MDIRPLVEAVMETAGKIKNDNMSDQDFYKLIREQSASGQRKKTAYHLLIAAFFFGLHTDFYRLNKIASPHPVLTHPVPVPRQKSGMMPVTASDKCRQQESRVE